MTCSRESLSSSPTFFLSSHSSLSVSSFSNRTNPAYFPSYHMCLFVRSHLQSESLLQVQKSTGWLITMCVSARKCWCLCVVVHSLSILNDVSNCICYIIGTILCILPTNICWMGRHVFIRHFIQQAENWPEYLPFLRSFCCVNVDPAALIASDSDNKNWLPVKTFWRPPPEFAQKSEKNEPNQTRNCFSLWTYLWTSIKLRG